MMNEDIGIHAESPLPPSIVRGLSDKSYDKRKSAAQEVTSLIKSLQESGDTDRISGVINVLSQEFCKSRNSNHRKGGLIGLAAAAIGLMIDLEKYLHLLIPPVLECFDDQEPRVCYYACEAAYNITKVSRVSALKYFNQMFDGLCKLYAHVDADVKNGANLLDRLLKDIISETDQFDIESFMPLLQKHLKKTKPYIRQLVISWITLLDAIPDINLLDYLPDILDGLFGMLSDPSKDIRQSADNALSEFLRELKQAEVVEFGPLLKVLMEQCSCKENYSRLRALSWIHEFVTLGGARLRVHYSGMLGSILYCISDSDNDIRNAASDANGSLLSLVRATTEDFELNPMVKLLAQELMSVHVITRVTCLRWVKMLHEKDPNCLNASIGELLPVLLKTLSDTAEEVLVINLQVLASISQDAGQFLRVLHALSQLFVDDRNLLETRGALIIRKLCALLDCKSVYITLADILVDRVDLDYASMMVQTLNLILLTAPELSPLRRLLRDSISDGTSQTDEAKQAFSSLFKCWCHNPVAVFSLCLFAQAYDLSAQLVFKFAEVDISIGFLMQVDKLIQLIESPIFLPLRLQLLDSHSHHHVQLVKSLYGLLMLLPQSVAYKTLSDRLSVVSSLHMHLGFCGSHSDASGKSKPEYQEYLQKFELTQQRHSALRLAILQHQSLLTPDR